MEIALAHSPDGDDAFMFYGLARGKVSTGDLTFSHVLSDIETLNRAARAVMPSAVLSDFVEG